MIRLFILDFRIPPSQALFRYLWNLSLSFSFYSSWSTLIPSLLFPLLQMFICSRTPNKSLYAVAEVLVLQHMTSLLHFCYNKYLFCCTASAGCDSMMQNIGTVRATQHSVCLISLVVVSAPDFLSCTCCEAQRDRVMEPINIWPDKNRAAGKEPLHGPSFFILSFLKIWNGSKCF